jgi:membrane protease subunit HflC
MTTINVKRRDAARQAYRAIKGIIIIVAAFIAALILFNMCTFSVGEAEQAVVFRFGSMNRMVLDPELVEQHPDILATQSEEGKEIKAIVGKGLFLKLPFFDRVVKYDSWLLTYVSQQEDVNTADKKKYQVTMYAQWRVANPALFNLALQTTGRASQYFDNTIYPILIQRINKMEADDFLSNKEMLNAALADALNAMNTAVRDAGIVVADLQIRRTLLPPANLQSTYDRMTANRQKVAQQYRSEGLEEYNKAVASADLEASRLIADATKQSKEIMGQADADALEIYAKSYSQDPEFYGYWRSLQALKSALGHDATIVLDRDNPLWKDLLDMILDGEIAAK